MLTGSVYRYVFPEQMMVILLSLHMLFTAVDDYGSNPLRFGNDDQSVDTSQEENADRFVFQADLNSKEDYAAIPEALYMIDLMETYMDLSGAIDKDYDLTIDSICSIAE